MRKARGWGSVALDGHKGNRRQCGVWVSPEDNQHQANEKGENKPTNPSAKKANDGMDFRRPSRLEDEHQCGNRGVDDKQ
jgi:hypothetical protein